MTDLSISLTDRAISSLPFASSDRYRVRDTDLTGFVLMIGKRKKTFYAEGEFWENGKRELRIAHRIGDAEDITAREARVQAKSALASISKGIRPGETERRQNKHQLTLRAAWERFLFAHLRRKGRAESTIARYEEHLRNHLADWMDEPLEKLGKNPKLMMERHDYLTEHNGPGAANGAMRTMRAIYNHATRANLDLPPASPTRAVDWNPNKRRNTAMGRKDLNGWFTELVEIPNPIRREFHLLTLLTGSRPTALKVSKPEHINFAERLLHIPAPKGGVDRAFDIPLSRAAIRCLVRALRYGRAMYPKEARQWIFPAESASGHMEEQKEERDVLSKWGNDLRQTYRTIGQVAGISKLDIHLLMNHAIPGVNEGYITRDKLLNDLLRTQQEKLSRMVVDSVSPANGKVKRWLRKSRVGELKVEWMTAGGFRAVKSNDPYHAVRMARRRAKKLGLPMPSTRRRKGHEPGSVYFEAAE